MFGKIYEKFLNENPAIKKEFEAKRKLIPFANNWYLQLD